MRPTLRGFAFVAILVLASLRPAVADDPPFMIQAPVLVQAARGDTVDFMVTAVLADPATPFQLYVHSVPQGASVTQQSDGTLRFFWIPRHGQVGEYFIEFDGVDQLGNSDEASTTIRIAGFTKLKIGTAPNTTVLDGPGDFVYTPWSASFALGPDAGTGIQGVVQGQDGARWELGFVSADGAPLGAGLYPGAGAYPDPRGPDDPGLVIGHPNCQGFEGAFRIEQLERMAEDSRSLHVRFEEGCVGHAPTLFGELFFNLDPTLLLDVPPAHRVELGANIRFDLRAIADDHADIQMIDPPPGADLLPWANNTFTFLWNPPDREHGEHRVRFVAQSEAELDTAETRIWIGPPNQAPVILLNGPLHTTVNVPIAIGCSHAYDPDGDPITCYTSFGDGTDSEQLYEEHVYTQPGVYFVLVRATDSKGLSTEDTTHVFVNAPSPARAFVVGSPTIRLGSGKPELCVQVEPLPGSYGNNSVSTIEMYRVGPLVNGIYVSSLIPGDRDHNGIEEVGGCFTKEDLRRLFADVQGRATIPVVITGQLATEFPNRFEAYLELEVVGSGKGALHAQLARDGQGMSRLSFETPTTGFVRVAVYDLAGRRVSAALEEAFGPAGAREVSLGKGLSPGVYFYRIETPGHTEGGRFVVLR